MEQSRELRAKPRRVEFLVATSAKSRSPDESHKICISPTQVPQLRQDPYSAAASEMYSGGALPDRTEGASYQLYKKRRNSARVNNRHMSMLVNTT